MAVVTAGVTALAVGITFNDALMRTLGAVLLALQVGALAAWWLRVHRR
ncbi:hypothetical protein [Frondihabitans australicus]|uniref:Uncharacterized protein n=1 Tax=Frondihabitans australicus TaxID=386892 RepID=A0A495IIY4_9MICO|nr:hypothetical protein [Frondihabitans australicus]RKR75982.1 hypothetical protein C8E83_3146 [Frondihabitans australicus]